MLAGQNEELSICTLGCVCVLAATQDLRAANECLLPNVMACVTCWLQVKIEEPIMRIPMLAIHLNRDIGTEGFKPNKQTHCVPVLATAIKKSMAGSAGKGLGLGRQGHHTLPCRTALCPVMDSVRQGSAGAWPGRHWLWPCMVLAMVAQPAAVQCQGACCLLSCGEGSCVPFVHHLPAESNAWVCG